MNGAEEWEVGAEKGRFVRAQEWVRQKISRARASEADPDTVLLHALARWEHYGRLVATLYVKRFTEATKLVDQLASSGASPAALGRAIGRQSEAQEILAWLTRYAAQSPDAKASIEKEEG